jgi:hypothetical protein
MTTWWTGNYVARMPQVWRKNNGKGSCQRVTAWRMVKREKSVTMRKCMIQLLNSPKWSIFSEKSYYYPSVILELIDFTFSLFLTINPISLLLSSTCQWSNFPMSACWLCSPVVLATAAT